MLIEDFNRVKSENEHAKHSLDERLHENDGGFIKPMDVKVKAEFKKLDAISYYKLLVECEMSIELVQICSGILVIFVEFLLNFC